MAQDAPRRVFARFFVKAVENAVKSAEAGRPIFEEHEFVELRWAGDNTRGGNVFPAHERSVYVPGMPYKLTRAEQYEREYAAFQKGLAEKVDGTPLSEVAFLTRSRVEELRADNVPTVEALAGLNDRAMARMGSGIRDLVQKAKDFLAQADGGAELARLRREHEELRARLAEMEKPRRRRKADTGPSEFEDWADENIAAFLTDAGVTVPDDWGRAEMMAKADELVAKAAKEKAA